MVDAAAEAARRAARSRRDLPGRIGRGGRRHRRRHQLHGREHFDEIDAEFAITEGGGATLIETAASPRSTSAPRRKLPARVRLVATGTAGHGSVPRLDNALDAPGRRRREGRRWETPMRLNDTTRTYFETLAAISPPERGGALQRAARPAAGAGVVQRYLAEHEPSHYSMLRTSVVPTMLKAGVGPNVIPSEAEATLDIRALPDENIPSFYAEMQRVIGDPAVKIVPMPADPAAVARLAPRHRDVPRAGAGQPSGCIRASTVLPSDVDRRERPGAAAREGHPVLRHRPGGDRRGRTRYRRPRRRGAPARVVAVPVRRVHLERRDRSRSPKTDPGAATLTPRASRLL